MLAQFRKMDWSSIATPSAPSEPHPFPAVFRSAGRNARLYPPQTGNFLGQGRSAAWREIRPIPDGR